MLQGVDHGLDGPGAVPEKFKGWTLWRSLSLLRASLPARSLVLAPLTCLKSLITDSMNTRAEMQGQMATNTTDLKLTEDSLSDVTAALKETEQDCRAKAVELEEHAKGRIWAGHGSP